MRTVFFSKKQRRSNPGLQPESIHKLERSKTAHNLQYSFSALAILVQCIDIEYSNTIKACSFWFKGDRFHFSLVVIHRRCSKMPLKNKPLLERGKLVSASYDKSSHQFYYLLNVRFCCLIFNSHSFAPYYKMEKKNY